MAKAGIHPDYHTITVVMTDGSRYETRSTWGLISMDDVPDHSDLNKSTGNVTHGLYSKFELDYAEILTNVPVRNRL